MDNKLSPYKPKIKRLQETPSAEKYHRHSHQIAGH